MGSGGDAAGVLGEAVTASGNTGLTAQLTPVGASSNLSIASEDLNVIVVRSSRDVKFHYQVNGVRKAYENFEPVVERQEFMPYSASAASLDSYPAEIRQRLIANGTYNPDGSINLDTARRLGRKPPEPGGENKKPALE